MKQQSEATAIFDVERWMFDVGRSSLLNVERWTFDVGSSFCLKRKKNKTWRPGEIELVK